MKFTPIKNSERGALGNHTDWEYISTSADDKRALIRCTCHSSLDRNSDLRWVNWEQLPSDFGGSK